jgi:hypothetical protein
MVLSCEVYQRRVMVRTVHCSPHLRFYGKEVLLSVADTWGSSKCESERSCRIPSCGSLGNGNQIQCRLVSPGHVQCASLLSTSTVLSSFWRWKSISIGSAHSPDLTGVISHSSAVWHVLSPKKSYLEKLFVLLESCYDCKIVRRKALRRVLENFLGRFLPTCKPALMDTNVCPRNSRLWFVSSTGPLPPLR